jgi:hypothetical protein
MELHDVDKYDTWEGSKYSSGNADGWVLDIRRQMVECWTEEGRWLSVGQKKESELLSNKMAEIRILI